MRSDRFDDHNSSGPRATERASDPLATAGREYAEVTTRLLAALRRVVEADADAVLVAALDVIERDAPLIAAASLRARRRPFHPAIGTGPTDRGPADPELHADGWVTDLGALIAGSSKAWQAFMEPGRARANGVPAAMLRRLQALQKTYDALFPW